MAVASEVRMGSLPNPLSWPGDTGTNMPPSLSGSPSVPGAPSLFGSPMAPTGPPAPGSGGFGGGTWGNPGGYGNPRGAQEIQRNTALTNILTGQYRNQLLPQFAQLMFGYGGDAGNFFKQLMNLGSPYYKEQQRASFEQGTQQGQNAAANANQRLNASGYGYAPSGLQAGVLGQEATGQAQNLSQMFLQNLFQNENLQAQGAQGLSQLAALFNPAQLTGQGSSQGGNISQPSSFFDNFQKVMSGLWGPGGGVSVKA
jgi:hypothetical protein